MLAQQGSLGAKVLDVFGVTGTAARQLVDALGAAGTTDGPQEVEARPIGVSVVQDRAPVRDRPEIEGDPDRAGQDDSERPIDDR